jgi:hypothetical protein
MPDEIISSRKTRANTSQAVSARETHGKPQFVRKPPDWMASSRGSVAQHGPTKTVFEISARPDLSPDDILTLEDFREAVLMALFLLGLAWPATVNADR